MPRKPAPTADEIKRELQSFELVSPELAARRTDALLRNMLASPPDPHVPAKPKRKAKK